MVALMIYATGAFVLTLLWKIALEVRAEVEGTLK